MILIVDDNLENIFSLKNLLQLHAFDVDTASSGEEALKKILKRDYTLFILDVQMPGMDGFEVAEAITGYSGSKDVPIIFLSAVNTDKRFITKGYASGAIDYVTKPFDPDLFLLKVKAFCKLSSQTKQLNDIQKGLKGRIETGKKAEELLEKKVLARTAQLLQANKELEKRNKELQQYAFIASHDLQEPLRKIQIFTELVVERYLEDRPEAADYLKKVLSCSGRMRSLINDLLTYSKFSQTLSFEKISLAQIVNESLSDLEVPIREKEALITVEELPEAEVVREQMRQVFQNLISNALKFSRKKGPVRIEIKADLLSEKIFDSEKLRTGDYCKITITDNGIGFNEAYLDKIFSMFQRLDTKATYEGNGIGLAIVKKIIDNHSGLITAKSQEGRGAEFIIILPLKHTSLHQTSTL